MTDHQDTSLLRTMPNNLFTDSTRHSLFREISMDKLPIGNFEVSASITSTATSNISLSFFDFFRVNASNAVPTNICADTHINFNNECLKLLETNSEPFPKRDKSI